MVDHMEQVLRKHHISALIKACTESGVIYRLLSNLERIADHAFQFSPGSAGEFQPEMPIA